MRPRAIALLLRQRTHLRTFAAALEEAGVPFSASGGTGFFEEGAVRLVASLLELVADPESGAAAVHVLESPLVGLDLQLLRWGEDGEITLNEIACRWLQEPESLPPDVPERPFTLARLEAFRALFAAARARALVLTPPDFLTWLFGAAGLRQRWRQMGEPQALRDLDKLVGLADRWSTERPGMTVAGYATRLRQQVTEQPEEPAPVEAAADVVEIATVHGAKGREWPVVFVADTQLPSKRSRETPGVLWDEQWGLVIGGGGKRRKGNDPMDEFRRERLRRVRNEERAIWYVALTRARDRLVVTHSRCEVDEHGHFRDADTDSGADTDERPVHFFHELWAQVRACRDELAEAVSCGPGPCRGGADDGA
jgi:superfamily I DNA/RNA helicase